MIEGKAAREAVNPAVRRRNWRREQMHAFIVVSIYQILPDRVALIYDNLCPKSDTFRHPSSSGHFVFSGEHGLKAGSDPFNTA
jgi:hypothetical protein